MDPTIATLATWPPRYNMALRVIQHVGPQVDHMFVYVNNAQGGRVVNPHWLKRLRPNVTALLASKAGRTLGDIGKFKPLPFTCKAFHILLDDDIDYPQDYVEALLSGIESHDRQYVCGFEGWDVDPNASSYFEAGRVKRSHLVAGSDAARSVQMLKTGVAGYHTSALDVTTADFRFQDMADIYFAIACQRQEVGMVEMRRDRGWLGKRKTPDGGITSRWEGKDAAHTLTLREIERWTTYAKI